MLILCYNGYKKPPQHHQYAQGKQQKRSAQLFLFLTFTWCRRKSGQYIWCGGEEHNIQNNVERRSSSQQTRVPWELCNEIVFIWSWVLCFFICFLCLKRDQQSKGNFFDGVCDHRGGGAVWSYEEQNRHFTVQLNISVGHRGRVYR